MRTLICAYIYILTVIHIYDVIRQGIIGPPSQLSVEWTNTKQGPGMDRCVFSAMSCWKGCRSLQPSLSQTVCTLKWVQKWESRPIIWHFQSALDWILSLIFSCFSMCSFFAAGCGFPLVSLWFVVGLNRGVGLWPASLTSMRRRRSDHCEPTRTALVAEIARGQFGFEGTWQRYSSTCVSQMDDKFTWSHVKLHMFHHISILYLSKLTQVIYGDLEVNKIQRQPTRSKRSTELSTRPCDEDIRNLVAVRILVGGAAQVNRNHWTSLVVLKSIDTYRWFAWLFAWFNRILWIALHRWALCTVMETEHFSKHPLQLSILEFPWGVLQFRIVSRYSSNHVCGLSCFRIV